MSNAAQGHSQNREVLEEFALVVLIVVGHTALVLLIIGCVYVVGLAIDAAKHGDHEPDLAGVTLRYIIEGGEIMLVGVIIAFGVASTAVTLGMALIRRIRGS